MQNSVVSPIIARLQHPNVPRELSDELCSLMENETRPALVCYIETDLAGNITAKPHFVSAYVHLKRN